MIRCCHGSGKLAGIGLTTVQRPEGSCTATVKSSTSAGMLAMSMTGWPLAGSLAEASNPPGAGEGPRAVRPPAAGSDITIGAP